MRSISFLILFLSFLFGPASLAGLGDKAESVSSDQKMLSAKLKTASIANDSSFTVKEIESESSTIKEYIDSTGTIFAVTWHGMSHPDLSVLLSSYYPAFQVNEKIQGHTKGQRQHKVVEANTLVVQRFGHMRDLRGRAYDSTLIPSGVSVDEIQ